MPVPRREYVASRTSSMSNPSAFRPHLVIVACDAGESEAFCRLNRAVVAIQQTCVCSVTIRRWGTTQKAELSAIRALYKIRSRSRSPSVFLFHARLSLSFLRMCWHVIDDVLTPSMSFTDMVERMIHTLVRHQQRLHMQFCLSQIERWSTQLLAFDNVTVDEQDIAFSWNDDIEICLSSMRVIFHGRASPPLSLKELSIARALVKTLHGDYLTIDDLDDILFGDDKQATSSRRSTIRSFVSKTWRKLRTVMEPNITLSTARSQGYMLCKR